MTKSPSCMISISIDICAGQANVKMIILYQMQKATLVNLGIMSTQRIAACMILKHINLDKPVVSVEEGSNLKL